MDEILIVSNWFNPYKRSLVDSFDLDFFVLKPLPTAEYPIPILESSEGIPFGFNQKDIEKSSSPLKLNLSSWEDEINEPEAPVKLTLENLWYAFPKEDVLKIIFL